jgi:sterol desaturase/sphingolipid hydroxylase (fatty acid hydroxylase superfamily)
LLSDRFFVSGVRLLPTAPGFAWIGTVQQTMARCPILVVALISHMAIDFALYWSHRLNHSRWLWHTHAFHHSPRNLYWLAGVRESPIHHIVLATPSLLVGLFFPMSGYVGWTLYWLAQFNQHLIHSNVRVPSRIYNAIFVTGQYHFVHHARDPRISNTNFGLLTTIWDHVFGTYTDPESLPKNFPLGLDYDAHAFRLLVGLPPGRSARSTPMHGSKNDEQRPRWADPSQALVLCAARDDLDELRHPRA